jgi:DNA-3-methyladenine glycosylase I
LHDDNELFERLVLEINQAGLSWETILKKKDNFHRAFMQFDIDTVANFSNKDRERLLSDASIIRNRLKVDAAIENAKRVQTIRKECGSFNAWPDWVKLFKQNFKFVGGEIVREFLLSTGYIQGAHAADCPVYVEIAELKPRWMSA